MQGVLSGAGGGVFSGASMSIVSRDDNVVLSSEDSSCPDESELELGLGLSLGGRDCARKVQKIAVVPFGKILTAEDFPSSISSPSSLSSSSSSVCSSSSLRGANVTTGSKRSSESVTPTNGGRGSQVVGWPPIRASRMSTLVNQAKPQPVEEFKLDVGKNKSKHTTAGTVNRVGDKNKANRGSRDAHSSLFVKVNMDGVPIGRKVNLTAHSCYETLAQALENMFLDHLTALDDSTGSTRKEHDIVRPSKLLNGSSEYMLAYEDREGDWMLVGDVPWGMFINSVKRLRIMRAAEAI